MAPLRYVADTSVVTRLREPTVVDRLEDLIVFGQVAITPMTALERGFSARSGIEYDKLNADLSEFEFVDIRDTDFSRARVVQRLLAAGGLRGRKVPDLLIAAAAERLGLCVLHYDRDFELIAGVTGQLQEWVVKPGLID